MYDYIPFCMLFNLGNEDIVEVSALYSNPCSSVTDYFEQ